MHLCLSKLVTPLHAVWCQPKMEKLDYLNLVYFLVQNQNALTYSWVTDNNKLHVQGIFREQINCGHI